MVLAGQRCMILGTELVLLASSVDVFKGLTKSSVSMGVVLQIVTLGTTSKLVSTSSSKRILGISPLVPLTISLTRQQKDEWEVLPMMSPFSGLLFDAKTGQQRANHNGISIIPRTVFVTEASSAA